MSEELWHRKGRFQPRPVPIPPSLQTPPPKQQSPAGFKKPQPPPPAKSNIETLSPLRGFHIAQTFGPEETAPDLWKPLGSPSMNQSARLSIPLDDRPKGPYRSSGMKASGGGRNHERAREPSTAAKPQTSNPVLSNYSLFLRAIRIQPSCSISLNL